MLNKVKHTIEEYNMLEKGDNVVIGFSGGPDSLSLLHILLSLKEEYNLSLYAVHINHMIRGEEALRDEEFSRNFCLCNGIKFYVKREDVNSLAKKLRLSSEEAGRKVRYDFFNEVVDSISGGKIALAHNLNDNGETIIMRLLRGTSLSGMGGISPKRDNIIRPLINCTRDEIEYYCEEKGLKPVIDSTNLQEVYTRNKIRLNVIPYIKENFNKNILENLHNNSKIARDEEEFMLSLVNTSVEDLKIENGYSIKEFNNLHIAMKRRVIRSIIGKILGSLNGIESKHIEATILLLSKGESGKRLDIKKGLVLSVNYGFFNISKKSKESVKVQSVNILNGTVINSYYIKGTIIPKDELERANNFIKYFDYSKIKGEVVVRHRLDGDYIYLKGLSGKKKLKDVFIDMKIPREKRGEIPVIAVGSEVLTVVGIRDSNSYNIDENTTKILKVKIEGV